jgi:hypothetical protein
MWMWLLIEYPTVPALIVSLGLLAIIHQIIMRLDRRWTRGR